MESLEEVQIRLGKIMSLRKLFLILGIVLIVVGLVGSFVLGIVLGAQAAKEGVSTENLITWEFQQPAYIVGTIIGSIMINAAIALLILRGTLLSAKMRKCFARMKELQKSEEPAKYY